MKSALALTAVVVAVFAPVAAADGVYPTAHLALTPVGDAPLRSGFVQNAKANGPVIYAHELFVLNGAAPLTTYTVTRHFFGAETCTGGFGSDDMAEIKTNGAGNGRGQAVVPASAVPPEFA